MPDPVYPPGPAAPPRCDYCECGRPAGVGPSYREGCPKHDPVMRAEIEEDIYAKLAQVAVAQAAEIADLKKRLGYPEFAR